MIAVSSFRRLGLLCAALLLSSCANTTQLKYSDSTAESYWQGKLSVKVYSSPVQAFAANFELQGAATKGELILTSPLGTTLARMRWSAGAATLNANGAERHFDSLQTLAQQVTGADIPVASLFAWLQGIPEEAPGWKADLHDIANGRISAQHIEAVQAELKIILER